MKFYYDLHIHSDLSPCAHNHMTPNNIVNMSYIKGLNIISVTDHNSTKNLPAIIKVSDNKIKIIPGIEVTTKEEVHVLCYFKNLYEASEFGDIIYESLPNIINNPVLFGQQNIYNEDDEIIGNLDKLLLSAASFSLKELDFMIKEYHGIMVPAHINKKSNSILGILGFIPDNLEFTFVEIYNKSDINDKLLKKYKLLINSDAHILTDISEPVNYMEIKSADEVFDYLKTI
ncbi:PHP domain-containing protein [Sedimentibacter sp.]|uniref:PHP domain-containing protein n=1 Tax=Sedimentibacter sp. TaxID=1960295 RepID=UPI0028A9C7DA|nr:PHP domain-containing protein [Sedimentibacter sp.]